MDTHVRHTINYPEDCYRKFLNFKTGYYIRTGLSTSHCVKSAGSKQKRDFLVDKNTGIRRVSGRGFLIYLFRRSVSMENYANMCVFNLYGIVCQRCV